MKKTGGFSRQGCVAKPMHILTLPLLGVVAVELSNIGHLEQTVSQPHEFRARTAVSKIPVVTRETA